MNELNVWVIYDHPRDYPNHFVVRKQVSRPGVIKIDKECHLTKTLGEARELVQRFQPGVVCFDRHPTDDTFIVESWL